MAAILQMNSGATKNFATFHKSSNKAAAASCFQAKMMACQSRKTNYYEVLSLESNGVVGLDDIKKAYRCKALKYHPDIYSHVSTKDESTTRFLEIREAYETLSDPVSRERYDHQLRLTDSTDRRYGSWSMESRRDASGLSRDLWERQMQGLKMRSAERMEKRRSKGME